MNHLQKHYDRASVHKTPADAIEAAAQGWQSDQIITDDLDCQSVVWRRGPECGQ